MRGASPLLCLALRDIQLRRPIISFPKARQMICPNLLPWVTDYIDRCIMLSHLYYYGLLVFCSDHSSGYHGAVIKHSLSCARCRRGSHPLRDLYCTGTRNDLKELMIGRSMNRWRSRNDFVQDLIRLDDLLMNGTRLGLIIPAAKLLALKVLQSQYTSGYVCILMSLAPASGNF